MPVAGKTGTTSATRDVWFAGFTPYYTCAVWAGYDTNEFLEDDCKSFHKNLWKKVMSRIHADLPYVDFEIPSTVKQATICTSSGLQHRRIPVAPMLHHQMLLLRLQAVILPLRIPADRM